MSQQKLARLKDFLAEQESIMVAFSGGVDSAFLLYLCHQTLGERCLAVTAVSPSLAVSELEKARGLARSLGVRHREVLTRELERDAYRRNHGDRCFHCKFELFETLQRLAGELGFARLAYGAIPEDLKDHRPGHQAAHKFEVLSPLADFGFDKATIRRLSREAGLPTHDQPAQACLASRIAYGSEVTAEKLKAVEVSEAVLKGLGFARCRVRHHAEIARIEVPVEDLARLLESPVRERVVQQLRQAGFLFVTVDLAGLRSGSMNLMLPLPVVAGQRK